MKKLVICGDSFNYGIGCSDYNKFPYGVLTANYFNWELIRLARGSASNYSIYLQGEFAVSLNPELVILGTTSTDRFEWISEGKELTTKPSLYNLFYHNYPPHFEGSTIGEPMDYYLKNNKNYDPKILTEQIPAIFEYRKLKNKTDWAYNYYHRLHTEPLEKLEIIEKYYVETFNTQIKAEYDRGIIIMAYRKLKKHGIKVIIFSPDPYYADYVDKKEEFYLQNWGEFVKKYPDPSKHTNDDGHKIIAKNLIKFIEDNNIHL